MDSLECPFLLPITRLQHQQRHHQQKQQFLQPHKESCFCSYNGESKHKPLLKAPPSLRPVTRTHTASRMKLDGVFLRSLRLVRFNNMPTKTHFNFMQTLPSLDVGLSKADFVRGLHTLQFQHANVCKPVAEPRCAMNGQLAPCPGRAPVARMW
jgi:hypothetical protein